MGRDCEGSESITSSATPFMHAPFENKGIGWGAV